MSSQLTDEQTAQETPLDRGKDIEVTLTFRVSAEAIDRLLPRNATRRQFEAAQATLLAAGLYTRLQALRDLQHTEKIDVLVAPGVVNVPGMRRKEELKQAGRYAQVALTHLETVALWSDKAVVWTL
jgi:hypothetical protein